MAERLIGTMATLFAIDVAKKIGGVDRVINRVQRVPEPISGLLRHQLWRLQSF